jgi:flavorubredoxin
MGVTFKASKINDNVYWVGAIDWELEDFHGYSVRGSTYNAFLILAEKITLIDTVKVSHKDQMLARIASVIEPQKIDYIISNHSEMDHTGSLPELIHIIKPEKVFASSAGVNNIAAHFHGINAIEPVSEGKKLSLGNKNLSFLETKMLHWPDSMVAYLEEDGILFSNDIFGMHWASSERYVDQIDPGVRDYEAAKYFANIFMPYANLAGKFLEKLNRQNWDIKMIAPDHGPIWRSDLNRIFEYYRSWSEPKLTRKALVVYDTMWGSTGQMANAIAEGLKVGGAEPKVMPIANAHRSDIATEILDSGALMIGSSTLNGQILPRVGDLLTYLRGLKPRHPLAAAFGSYGWAPKAVMQINEAFDDLRLEKISDGVEAKFVPTTEDLNNCYSLGLAMAAKLAERIGI